VWAYILIELTPNFGFSLSTVITIQLGKRTWKTFSSAHDSSKCVSVNSSPPEQRVSFTHPARDFGDAAKKPARWRMKCLIFRAF